MIQALHRIRADSRGVTIVEFAIVVVPLALAILAFMDLGHRIFLTAQLNGTLHQAARMASIGDTPGEEIDSYVKSRISALIDPQHVKITKRAYTDFSRVGKPEKITSDTTPKGAYNVGDCFEDGNGNGQYDASGGSTGLGGADDIVHYEVEINYPRFVPLGGLGWGSREIVKANTVLKNQPYALKAKPSVVCTK